MGSRVILLTKYCQKCGEKFTKPDKLQPYPIFTKKMGNYTKWYHLTCAEMVNLI
jgi:hypothetical protein